jgi:hypothetical protein
VFIIERGEENLLAIDGEIKRRHPLGFIGVRISNKWRCDRVAARWMERE